MRVFASWGGPQGPRNPSREVGEAPSAPMSAKRERRQRDRTDHKNDDYRGDAKAGPGHEFSASAASEVAATTDSRLFGRILHRPKSKKEKNKRSAVKNVVSTDEVALPSVGVTKSENARHYSEGSAAQQQSGVPVAAQQSASDLQAAPRQPLGRETPVVGPAVQTPAPLQPLKKKSSLLGRLRSRTNAVPNPAPIEEKKAYTTYVPKHAALDFSRLGVAGARPSFDESEGRMLSPRQKPMETVAETPPLEDCSDFVKPRLLSRPMQTLVENEAILAGAQVSQRTPIVSDKKVGVEFAKKSSETSQLPEVQVMSKVRPQSAGNRGQAHSHRPVADHWEAPRPVTRAANETQKSQSSGRVLLSGSQNSVNKELPNPESLRTSSDKMISRYAKRSSRRGSAEAQQASDYELFLARAEVEDRVQREQLLHDLSRRYAPNSRHQTPVNPHPQLAASNSPTTGPVSAGTTAVPSHSAPSHESASPGGSQSRRDTCASVNAHYLHVSEDERSFDKRYSWVPDQERPGKSLLPTWMPESAVTDVDPSFAKSRPKTPRPKTPQPTRTLRRQASITQRISEYIRPPREQVPIRPPSRMAIRRPETAGPRLQQAVAMLVE